MTYYWKCGCEAEYVKTRLDKPGEHFECPSCQAMWGWDATEKILPWDTGRCFYYITGEAVREVESGEIA